MKLIESELIDTNVFTDENSCKIYLMDKIIEQFLPVFSKDVERKKSQLNESREDIVKLKNDILQIKMKLKNFLRKIEKEEIKKNIFIEIQLLIEKDLLYGKNKQIVKDILISLDDSEENLKNGLDILKSIG
jgi:hypothetical protein